jgi:hypothetical protein
MPIHFGYAANKDQKPSTALRFRGLNLVRAPPSNVKVSFVPDALLFAYYLVIATLGNFLASIATGKVVKNGKCSRIPKLPHLVPIRLPPLVVQIQDNNIAMVNAFIASGFESQVIRKKTLLMKDRPDLSDFQSVMGNPSVNRKCQAPWNYVNTEGMMAFLTLRKVATLFLGLDILAAFDDSRRVTDYLRMTSTDRTPAVPSAEASTSTPTSITTSYSWSWERYSGTSLLKSDPQSVTVDSAHLSLSRGFGSLAAIADTVNQPGVYLPYVAELAREDDSGPIPFIKRHAFNCLGDSFEHCYQELEQMRRGWGVLKHTASGHQLSHLYRCMELAIEGQATLRAIITESGKYQGCVIIGSGYSIISSGVISRPLNSDALKLEMLSYGGHEIAQRHISIAVWGEDFDNRATEIEFPTSMSALREVILETQLNEGERDTIRRWAPQLDFEIESWGVNPTNLGKFLEIATTGEIPEDTPISVESLFEVNVGVAALSAFGHSGCPSFRIPSGRSLNLRGKMPEIKHETTVAVGKKRKATQEVDDFECTIQVQLIDFRRAKADWIQTTVDGTISVIPVGNTSENIRVYRGKDRGLLWNQLSRVVHNAGPGVGPEDTVLGHGMTGLSGHGTTRREDTHRKLDDYL